MLAFLLSLVWSWKSHVPPFWLLSTVLILLFVLFIAIITNSIVLIPYPRCGVVLFEGVFSWRACPSPSGAQPASAQPPSTLAVHSGRVSLECPTYKYS